MGEHNLKYNLYSYLKIALIAALIICTYYKTFVWMEDRWGSESSYYSHGYLIPFITIFLIWRERDCFREMEYGSSKWGLTLFLTGMLLQISSVFMRVHFLSGFSCILVLSGTLFYLLGKKVGYRLLFPILFLITLIPLPLSVIAGLSLKMKLFAAVCAVKIIDIIGITVVQDGSKIFFSNCTLVVGDVCSGLKSLIALIAFGALYAYVSRGTFYLKPFLFMASIPAAIVANIIRILILCLVARNWGSEVASGIVHDITGILIFAIAFVPLYLLSTVLQMWERPHLHTNDEYSVKNNLTLNVTKV
ncbi:MAG: exosortase/archaeosortase family protein [Planctomycetes bacterium]|nr:exosortase/archaeosortase family protein [Planctomycetota bacterium]